LSAKATGVAVVVVVVEKEGDSKAEFSWNEIKQKMKIF
jgi:hypothetical protein